ncbi:DUF3718 domain-containing protein [Thalassomonas sp. M1454]|uniref:DUF3718 domain-containing protein n=1 Tax=Thalassomonas sp. M1454 TaxID=2594477 RepID=UPI00118088B0|nr:DUF3718 domain-containing protein [Thalassomonas sp. M1454]TRX55073.1 DUF3718 domain-containing protein [Thalassomonas sp. M1454]
MTTLKTLTSIAAITTLALSVSVQAKTAQFDTSNADRSMYTCIAAASNDVSKLKKLMKLEPYGEKSIVTGLKCNDMDISDFAASYYAVDTVAYLNKFATQSEQIDVVALAAKKQATQIAQTQQESKTANSAK